MEEQTRDCKACIYSKNGKCAGTEECHECMWENKFKQKSYNEVEDCISRQAVNTLVDELARAISDERCYMSRGRSTGRIMQDILDLPPVTPKEKTGKWKVQHTKLSHLPSDTIVTCLECGHTKSRIDGEILNFCPNCGVRMVRE